NETDAGENDALADAVLRPGNVVTGAAAGAGIKRTDAGEVLAGEVTVAEHGIDRQAEITARIGGEKPVHHPSQRGIERVVVHIVGADRDTRGAWVVGEERTVGNAAAGVVAVGDDEARVAKDDEVQAEGVAGAVENG